MNRDWLREQGLDDKQIEQIMKQNGEDIENAKSKKAKEFETERDSMNSTITDLRGQLDARTNDVAGLTEKLTAAQTDAGKLTEAQSALEKIQRRYETEKADWEKKTAQQKYDFAIREQVSGLKFTSTAAKKEFTREAIEAGLKMDGDTLMGFGDFVAKYRESDPTAFVEDPKPQKNPADPEPTPGTDPKPTITVPGTSGAGGVKKSLADMMKAKNSNPDMQVSF